MPSEVEQPDVTAELDAIAQPDETPAPASPAVQLDATPALAVTAAQGAIPVQDEPAAQPVSPPVAPDELPAAHAPEPTSDEPPLP